MSPYNKMCSSFTVTVELLHDICVQSTLAYVTTQVINKTGCLLEAIFN